MTQFKQILLYIYICQLGFVFRLACYDAIYIYISTSQYREEETANIMSCFLTGNLFEVEEGSRERERLKFKVRLHRWTMFNNNKNMETNGSLHFKIALFVFLFLQWSVGTLASGNVTMESIQIFRTHEWFGNKPMVYFRCQGENKIYLPDLKEKNHMYTFKGEESWQPLTALADRKCKRCGLYEEDKMTPDDIFDEWELCPDEFSPAPEGRYEHYKENEFNATFLCSQCNASDSGSTSEPGIIWPAGPISKGSGKSNYNAILGIVILCVSFIAVVGLAVVFYRVLQKRRREEEQARFLKLFEEDDLEAELGLKDEL